MRQIKKLLYKRAKTVGELRMGVLRVMVYHKNATTTKAIL